MNTRRKEWTRKSKARFTFYPVLCIEGDGIRIVEFDSAHAKIILDRRINGINYFDDMPREKKSGFFSKLFP